MSNPAESHQVVLITGELPGIYAQYQRVQNLHRVRTLCLQRAVDKSRLRQPQPVSAHDHIKQMVKEKIGRAMQEKECERKGKNGKFIKVAGCSPIREGILLIRPDTTLAVVRKFGEECQRRWGITPLQIFLHKDEAHRLNGQPEVERRK